VNYPVGKGAVVYPVVPGSPAEKAGLRPEDVVVKFANHDVESRGHLFTLIQRAKVGTDVPIQVLRDGKGTTMMASIVDSVEGQAAAREDPEGRSPSDQEIAEAIGIKVRNLRPIEQRYVTSGVLVVEVLPGSLADRAGVQIGDLIFGLNDRKVADTAEFFPSLLASAAAQSTVLIFQRGGLTYRVALPRVPRTGEENP
jgi:serine protease Do